MRGAASACARWTFLELLRARLAWALAAYAALLAALPALVSAAAPPARAAAIVSILHAATVLFGAALAVVVSTPWIPRDLRTRVLHGVLSKPATGAEYLLGRLGGIWLFLTFAALLFLASGAALLSWVDASVAPLATDEEAGELVSFERTRERAVARWRLLPAGRRDEGLHCRLESPSNPFWRPRLATTFRSLPDGKAVPCETAWTGGKLLLHLPVPAGTVREGTERLELEVRTADGSRLDRLLAADARPLLVRRSRSAARLWAADAGSIWLEMLVVSALGLALSTFCSFPVAALAAASLCLAANALPFLREMPRMIDPEALPQILSPTLQHTHAHGAGEEEPAAYRWGRRAATGAVEAFCAICPDLGRVAEGRRMEEGLILGWREWAARSLSLLPHLGILALLGAARLSWREYP